MTDVAKYAVTVGYLRPRQVISRIGMLARRRVLHRITALQSWHRTVPADDLVSVPLRFPVPAPVRCPVDDLRVGRFTFLNRTAALGRPVSWHPSSESQLWVYNLHYFDYAVALACDRTQPLDDRFGVFRTLVQDWIGQCPPGQQISWDPYPVSLRISNWLKAYAGFGSALAGDPDFALELRRSLYQQASFLAANVEHHLQGNHVLENGRALLEVGLFFTGHEARCWRDLGQHLLWVGARDQVLDDGGHVERSPMYHLLMLELYREVVHVLESVSQTVPEPVKATVRRMERWLAAVTHPDGDIALLNDSAIVGPPGRSGAAVARPARPAPGLQALPDTGYFTFRDESRGAFLIMDCGSLGPDYQPGHGHCDTLSYELSVGGHRLVVDSGVDDYYRELEWRTYYRSTRAHNTVTVDGEEQAEIWGRFRVARRGGVADVVWRDEGESGAYVIGTHRGIRRLGGRVDHRRWITWVDRRFWVVCDRLAGRGRREVASYVHFDPGISVVVPPDPSTGVVGQVSHGSVSLQVAPWGVDAVSRHRGETSPLQGWQASEFGRAQPNEVWRLTRVDELPLWTGYLLWPEASPVTVRCVRAEAGSCELEVTHGGGVHRIEHRPDAVVVTRR